MKVKFLTYVLKLISVNLNFSVKAMTVWQCGNVQVSVAVVTTSVATLVTLWSHIVIIATQHCFKYSVTEVQKGVAGQE